MTRPRSEREAIARLAEAGVPCVPAPSDDPIGDWIELMEAIEALCPHWPERESSIGWRFEL